ncbi:FhaA domain-containing protein [Neomoorella carbonis]|uniref:FhaA domain-containing protein n=1 Tax=Neomoorella carbonis TaxID=3062783 RepID=UPI0032502435
MDWLEKNERFWQRLFDSLFRRGADVPLQPVEIAKKLVKTMVARRTVSVSRVYVPNIYLVHLNPKDFERLSAFEHALASELAGYLKKKAAEQNLTMVGEPRVELEVEDELGPGEVRIHARMEEERPQEEGNPHDEGDTLIYKAVEEGEVDRPGQPSLKLTVIAGPDAGRTFLLRPGKQVLGRQPACDFILTDEQVSRRHCHLEENHDRVLLVDLGSRNGTLVNGKRVERAFLKPGDRIQVGRTVLELQVS